MTSSSSAMRMLCVVLVWCSLFAASAQQTTSTTTTATTTAATNTTTTEKVDKPIVYQEPEAAPGCPIPDLRYSRPRNRDAAATSESPSAEIGDTAALSAGGGADQSADLVRHLRYIDYDPYDLLATSSAHSAPSAAHQQTAHHIVHRRKARSHSTSAAASAPRRSRRTRSHLADAEAHYSFEIGENLSAPRRVKRKSGKTTGALSRPKGASDSGSKSTSRKKEGATVDEEGQYIVHASDGDDADADIGEEEEEEENDVDEHEQFGEVAEVRFPAEVGTQGERKLCRIRCVHGKWVGPICGSRAAEAAGEPAAGGGGVTPAGLE